MAHAVGFAFVAAGVTGFVSLVFPAARFGSPVLAAAVATFAFTVGAGLLVVRRRGKSYGEGWYVLALATLTVSFAVYASGAPVSGAMCFYLWVVPYAFALSPKRAAAQTAWMAACYGAVLMIQAHEHPTIGAKGELEGLWFISVVTVCAVGMLVRALSRSLRDADRHFHRAFQDSQIGAAFVSTDGRWLDVNPALLRLLGRDREEVLGMSLTEMTVPDDRDKTDEAVAAAANGPIEYEKRYSRPDGGIVWVEVSASLITPESGTPYLFSQYRDVTAHKLDRDALAHQAVHDPLTGLFNRTLLLDRLQLALAREEAVAVILLDLDGFKFVNDSIGHHAGDKILTELAPRLAAATAPGDTLARLGGDEFVVLCEGLKGRGDVHERARRLAPSVAAPIEISPGRQHKPTASLGVSLLP